MHQEAVESLTSPLPSRGKPWRERGGESMRLEVSMMVEGGGSFTIISQRSCAIPISAFFSLAEKVTQGIRHASMATQGMRVLLTAVTSQRV